MLKLLTAYRANRSPETALKLRIYNFKHPMAACMLTADDSALLKAAIDHANYGFIRQPKITAEMQHGLGWK